MIDEVRELLKKIDSIVESETRRLLDEIEELKKQINENIATSRRGDNLEEELKILEEDLEYSKKENNRLQQKLEQYKRTTEKNIENLEEQNKLLKQKISQLENQLEGYKFTVEVISEWIPSQKENIDVLVSLSSAPLHIATIEQIQKQTRIAKVTLKNRILPILKENGLVSIEKGTIKLTLKKQEL